MYWSLNLVKEENVSDPSSMTPVSCLSSAKHLLIKGSCCKALRIKAIVLGKEDLGFVRIESVRIESLLLGLTGFPLVLLVGTKPCRSTYYQISPSRNRGGLV